MCIPSSQILLLHSTSDFEKIPYIIVHINTKNTWNQNSIVMNFVCQLMLQGMVSTSFNQVELEATIQETI
jgi:hypothetical protein